MEKNHLYEEALQNVRRSSCPSDLKIVDMKVCDLEPPFSATIIKLITNQGLEGYGQVREGGSRVYALMLKRLLLGENPCNVDKIFRRIKQFGYHSHQAGGVSGVEMALWDLAGKAYGVPAYQLLGGKFRDQIRVYCDTDTDGKPDGKRMGAVLKERIEKKGYTIMKMDLSIMELLYDVEGALTYPTGELKEYMESLHGAFGYHGVTAYDPKLSREEQLEAYARRNNLMKRDDIPGPSRGIHITELGLDILEQYVKDVRDVVGYQIPIAVDHFGPIGVGDCIRLGNRLEKYNMAWLEDMVPLDDDGPAGGDLPQRPDPAVHRRGHLFEGKLQAAAGKAGCLHHPSGYCQRGRIAGDEEGGRSGSGVRCADGDPYERDADLCHGCHAGGGRHGELLRPGVPPQ